MVSQVSFFAPTGLMLYSLPSMPDGKILQVVTVRCHVLSVSPLLIQSRQSRSAADTTVVVTATSAVKVWLKKVPVSQIEPKDSLTVAPTTGISIPQLVAIVFITILVNLAVTQYQTITRPCIGFIGSWMLTAVQLFKECMHFTFSKFNQLIC